MIQIDDGKNSDGTEMISLGDESAVTKARGRRAHRPWVPELSPAHKELP